MAKWKDKYRDVPYVTMILDVEESSVTYSVHSSIDGEVWRQVVRLGVRYTPPGRPRCVFAAKRMLSVVRRQVDILGPSAIVQEVIRRRDLEW